MHTFSKGLLKKSATSHFTSRDERAGFCWVLRAPLLPLFAAPRRLFMHVTPCRCVWFLSMRATATRFLLSDLLLVGSLWGRKNRRKKLPAFFPS